MTGRDKRSVGELLLESDHIARAILMDVDEMDAAMMVRTWGEVVQAAAELWQALPPVTPPQPLTGEHLPDSADLAIQQLQAMTEALHRTGHGRAWPGDGPADERLLRIAESFTRAADLISRHATPRPPLSEPERRDLQAARIRILHTLYIGCHGVAVGVGRQVRKLETKFATRGRPTSGDSLRQARAAHARLTAFEQHAGAVIKGNYPRALTGEHCEPPAAGRLAQALATWDVQGPPHPDRPGQHRRPHAHRPHPILGSHSLQHADARRRRLRTARPTAVHDLPLPSARDKPRTVGDHGRPLERPHTTALTPHRHRPRTRIP